MMILSITGGVLLGAGIWVFLKGGVEAMRRLARRTRTQKDDAVVDKIDDVVRVLEEHPELVELLHRLGRKLS